MSEAFWAAARRASEEVRKWPAWKRGLIHGWESDMLQVIETCPHCGKELPGWIRPPITTVTWTTHDRGTPHKCPRCDGSGRGYWTPYEVNNTSAPNLPIVCNACGGTGILWSKG